ncbi:MAG TPA: N-acetylglucosamine-6-phosphate deacetylase, partial [Thermomicrobiales bacterium]|nr:N-acetylglucosamine-6-phosphate deacetylase [Thermomicrobiales bacterium]
MTTASTYAVRGKLVFGTHLDDGTLVIENGRIASIQRGHASDGNLPDTVFDAHIVSPGLIDLQVNGAFGREANENPDDIDYISKNLVSTGCTAWLPTIVTAFADFYPPVFESWPRHNPDAGAVPLGFHLEGPFISREKKGAHRIECIDAASDELFDSWLEQDSIVLVTLAPEREGATDRIRRLVERGILVSLGHTNATYEQFIAGIDAGARKATHLYNTMPQIHHRTPGAMVATLVDERVTAGLIPDGIHSHPATVRLALKSKGVDGIAIVSDMMSACGLGPGTYTLATRDVTVDETSARLEDGTLAGSILTMDQALRNLVDWSDTTPAEALHMMTAVPARLLGDES